ncbi:MAG TPA: hypothetical protein PLH84_04885 [Candidatus Krumholzibacteria bacterium]|nr:hypothetical protein [Candidatus Krumholzibacteria bacterium]
MSERTAGRIAERLEQVWDWGRDHDFRGADPYDGLTSRLLAPVLPLSRLLRLAVIQGVKRSPLDLRPLLLIPPGSNPKGLALFLSGLALAPDLPEADAWRRRLLDRMTAAASLPDGSPAFGGREDVTGLAARVEASDPEAPLGWGYHFPWQARAFLQRAWDPTVVATSFVLDALADTGAEHASLLTRRAARFVAERLHRHEDADGICFSYSPTDRTRVYNASLFGAKILARAAAHETGARAAEYRSLALAAGDWVVSRQRDDGAWVYGEADHWRWVDNLHTGFNLETLDFLERALAPGRWTGSLAAGLDYYRRTMIEADGTACYYDTGRAPLDAHTFAQTAITLLALRDRGDGLPDTARRVLLKGDDELWDSGRRGYRFQKSGRFPTRVISMRWSQGWMFRALAMARAAKDA